MKKKQKEKEGEREEEGGEEEENITDKIHSPFSTLSFKPGHNE